ncbi:MAG: SDR family oxidoreductase [Pseudomonadota bacterium]
MAGETVLVTGVSRGIGAAIATRLADDGLTVIGVSTRPMPAFRGVHAAIDLSEPSAKTALAELAGEHRPLRLVANAGIVTSGLIESVTDADFEATLRVNLQAVLWSMQAVLPAMREARWGRIVAVGSRAALGKTSRASYSASKAGLGGLVRTAALELGPASITVNTVAPGPIETEMLAENQPPGSPARERLLAGVPLGRCGRPEEVAAAIAFLLGEDAGYITGQTLHVCGGLSVGGMAG